MSILENYLDELFGPKYIDADDPSLPNPYNFRQLKLDPKITATDIRNMNIRWSKSYEKGWVNEKDFKDAIKQDSQKWKNGKYYVIVDKGKRVGIVGFSYVWKDPTYRVNLVYGTWVKGKNYATAGIMKLLNIHPLSQSKKSKISFSMMNDNIASVKVGENLKGKTKLSDTTNKRYFTLYPPYWWNKKKFLKH